MSIYWLTLAFSSFPYCLGLVLLDWEFMSYEGASLMNDLIEFLELFDLNTHKQLESSIDASGQTITEVLINLTPAVDNVMEIILKSGLF